jgi:hypothetical protein
MDDFSGVAFNVHLLLRACARSLLLEKARNNVELT